MVRAKQSAQIIADAIGAKLIVRPNLQPLDIGNLAGKKDSTVHGYLKVFAARPTLNFPEGEKFGGWEQRIRKEWTQQFEDDDPAIALVFQFRGLPMLRHCPQNCMDAEI